MHKHGAKSRAFQCGMNLARWVHRPFAGATKDKPWRDFAHFSEGKVQPDAAGVVHLYFTYCCGVWVTNGAMAPLSGESRLEPGTSRRHALGSHLCGRHHALSAGDHCPIHRPQEGHARGNGGGIAPAMFVGTSSSNPSTTCSPWACSWHRWRQLRRSPIAGFGLFSTPLQRSAMGLVGAGNIGTSRGTAGPACWRSFMAGRRCTALQGWASSYRCWPLSCWPKNPTTLTGTPVFASTLHACSKRWLGICHHLCRHFWRFIGLTTFLPSYYYDQFGVSKIQAGQPDHAGGLWALHCAFSVAGFQTTGAASTPSQPYCSSSLSRWCCADWQKTPLVLTTCCCWCALPHWARAMVPCFSWCRCAGRDDRRRRVDDREIGALGGGLVPNAMGLSKQYPRPIWGFVLFAMLTLCPW